jgi:hypothetical protein
MAPFNESGSMPVGFGFSSNSFMIEDSVALSHASVTKPNPPEGSRQPLFVMTLPNGKKRSFDTLVELAQWSAANAIGKLESEWLKNGREIL